MSTGLKLILTLGQTCTDKINIGQANMDNHIGVWHLCLPAQMLDMNLSWHKSLNASYQLSTKVVPLGSPYSDLSTPF